MKRRSRLALFCVALVSVAAVGVPAAETTLHFLAPNAIDFNAVLPPPPAVGSPGALGDLETVLRVQTVRTPNDVAWALLVEHDSVFNHAAVLGPWFTKDNLPATAAFMKSVTDDMFAISRGAKNLYPRPRPPRVDPAVKPCVELSESGSYPSGHSMQATVWALVLAEIFPEQRDALIERAHLAAWGRVIGGVHFPSDTIGGRMLGEAIVAELKKSPAFREGIEKCRAEAARFLLKKAA